MVKIVINNFRKLSLRQKAIVIVTVTIAFLVFVVLFIPPVWKLGSGVVEVKRTNSKKEVYYEKISSESKDWVSLNQVSRSFISALLISEDDSFYEHSGFDYKEIKKSIETNVKKKRYARGGSTISQQLVKNLFLSREKSIVRKLREALGTLVLEKLYSKKLILEWYVNIIEFSQDTYGIQNGAKFYFNKNAQQLSLEESIMLVSIIPNPKKWSEGIKRSSLTEFGKKRFIQILKKMKQRGLVSEQDYFLALSSGNFGAPIDPSIVPEDDLDFRYDYMVEENTNRDEIQIDSVSHNQVQNSNQSETENIQTDTIIETEKNTTIEED